MPNIASSLATTQNYIPLINAAGLGKAAGLHMHFATFAALQAAVTAEQDNISATSPLLAEGQPMSVSGEVGVRLWTASPGHARKVRVRDGLIITLAGDANKVLTTSGAPSSGTGANGDIAVDYAGNKVYTKSAGAWSETTDIFVEGGGGGSGEVEVTFSEEIQFANAQSFSSTTQTGDLNFTLAASGNTRNSYYTVEIYPDFTNDITIDEDDFHVEGAIDTSQINFITFHLPKNPLAKARAIISLEPTYAALDAATGLSATGLSGTTMEIDATVDANASQFDILRSPSGAGTFAVVGTTAAFPYVDSGLSVTTTYDYKILSKAYGRTSTLSAQFSGTTSSGTITQSLQMSVLNDVVGFDDPTDDFDFNIAGADQPFSVGIWVKTSKTTGQPLIVKADATSDMWGISMTAIGNNLGFVVQGPTGAYLYGTIANTWSDGAWHRIVCTYSGSETFAGIKMYVDGTLQSLTDNSSGSYTGIRTGGTLTMGYSSAFVSQYYEGKCSNLVIVDRVLTALEVTEDYNSGNVLDLNGASFAADMISYYPLSGDLADAVGAHDGSANAETYSSDIP